jgi:arylsulfatase A
MSALSRRSFLATAAAPLVTSAAPAKPNIVYILCDDLGYGDLRCYNPESKIPTPNVDRFAAQGVRFTDAHSPSSVCTPTRYGIMTGRYCWRSRLKKGVLDGKSPSLIEPGRLTVASMLKAQGYRTAGVGKWHLGLGTDAETNYSQPLKPSPLDFGFDSYFGIPASLDMEPYLYFENNRAVEAPTGQVAGIREKRGIFWREGRMAPSFKHADVLPVLTRKAVEFIRQPAPQPFFLYLPLTGPHTPWLPSEKFKGRSGAGPYGDFAAMVDDAIGQVLGALDDKKLASNTLVVVTSDNGAHWLPDEIAEWGHRSNGALRGQKADVYDGGHRIPFIARWPGRIKPGTTSNALTCLTDFMATAADITRAALPGSAGEDSFSMLPAMEGQTGRRTAIVHHSANGHFVIRDGDWKLHLGLGSGGFTPPVEVTPPPGEAPGELFNLKDDPAEQRNLYAAQPAVVARLTALLARYQADGRSRPA